MILPVRRKRDTFLPWIQLLADVLSTLAVLRFVFWFRFGSFFLQDSHGATRFFPIYNKSFAIVALILVFFLRAYGLYRPARILTFAQETGKVFKAVAVTTFVMVGLTFFIRHFSFSRTYVAMAGLLLAAGVSLTRFSLGLMVMVFDRWRGSYRNVLVLGVNENVRQLIRFYLKNARLSTRVVGILDDTREKNAEWERVPVLGRVSDLPQHLRKSYQVHEVVLALQGLPREDMLKIIYECEKEMVTFRWIADVFGLLTSKMNVSHLGPVSLLSFTDSPLSDWENRALKRSLDILISYVALILFMPLMCVIAVLIKRDSKGPVFYRQERVGEDGKKFDLIKFRTMRVGAEEKTGPVWASQDDPRRTKLGEFLRKNNLDELPQLWNVLVGDMSWVGPRPERPFFVSQFREDIPRYMARHSIRSGITGWAQVNGLRGNTSIEERTKFDLYYIENWSLWLDIKILFMTLFARRNAY